MAEAVEGEGATAGEMPLLVTILLGGEDELLGSPVPGAGGSSTPVRDAARAVAGPG